MYKILRINHIRENKYFVVYIRYRPYIFVEYFPCVHFNNIYLSNVIGHRITSKEIIDSLLE